MNILWILELESWRASEKSQKIHRTIKNLFCVELITLGSHYFRWMGSFLMKYWLCFWIQQYRYELYKLLTELKAWWHGWSSIQVKTVCHKTIIPNNRDLQFQAILSAALHSIWFDIPVKPIGLVNNIPTMQFWTGIFCHTQSVSYMLSLTD